MSHDVAGGVLAMFGVICVRLAISDAYLAYLKPQMGIPLGLTGVVLVVLGIATIWRTSTRRRAASRELDPVAAHGDVEPGDRSDDDHGHDHGRAPRVAWLLATPLLALVLIAPDPLGAYAAERQSALTPSQRVSFPPLPDARAGAVELRMGDFLQRAIWDPERTLVDVPVRLSGFVVPDRDTDGAVYLTRFALACCAADAIPMHVRITGLPEPLPATDTWLSVTGTWVPSPQGGYDISEGAPVVELAAVTAVEIPTPTNPYE